MSWGIRIVLSFVVFAIIVITMVIISLNQDINLVADDYYRQEIEYEDQIQRIRNTHSLEETPEIAFDRSAGAVVIKFPGSVRKQVKEGEIHLFRPSDSKQDKYINLDLDQDGSQTISVAGHQKGLWKIKILWSDGDKEYYSEKTLVF